MNELTINGLILLFYLSANAFWDGMFYASSFNQDIEGRGVASATLFVSVCDGYIMSHFLV